MKKLEQSLAELEAIDPEVRVAAERLRQVTESIASAPVSPKARATLERARQLEEARKAGIKLALMGIFR